MEFGKHVKVREEKFGSVVFETLREKVYVTNETGQEIIRILQEKKDAREVAVLLADKYDCDLAAIEKDVNEYVACLKEKNIIV